MLMKKLTQVIVTITTGVEHCGDYFTKMGISVKRDALRGWGTGSPILLNAVYHRGTQLWGVFILRSDCLQFFCEAINNVPKQAPV